MVISTIAALALGQVLGSAEIQGGGRPGGGGPGSGQGGGPQNQSYDDVVKDYAKKEGVFTLFQKDESVLLQLPKKVFGRDFLWVTELKHTPNGGYNGSALSDGVVRFEERGNRIFLRKISYQVRASGTDKSIKTAVEQSNVQPIMESFAVRTRAADGSPVIDVSRFFTSDIPEFPAARSIGGSVDPARTMYDHIALFPENINVYVLMTVRGGGAPAGGGRNPFGGGGNSNPSNTGLVSHSITLLPEKPMMGRLKDSRVGYFDTGFEDYGTEYHGVKELSYINRYRLEKKNPSAAMSEPVKPIIYYLSPEIPAKWKEYCRKGVEDWGVAFEAAGFKNAIKCLDAPNDPDWSPEDARFSVIRWAPLPIANAMGPSVVDPRSGEIISAHIIMWHDILKLQTQWYFSQASAIQPQFQRLPLPDSKMGELLQFVVAHEVGHTLGLPHNGKSSSTVSIAQLRSPAWTSANGTATSIMDYARFNYVAQPGDGVQQVYPIVGKQDKHAIMWGYSPIAGASTPDAEKPTLDAWAAQQIGDPQLRFYDNFASSDPTCLSESLSSDNVEASKLGTANLKRMMGYLVSATVKTGEDYSELQGMHQNFVGQFNQYIGHVMAVVGGIEFNDFHGGRGGDPYKHVPAEYQRRAVAFFMENVMQTPKWIVPASVVNKFGSDSGRGTVTGMQNRVLNGLWQDGRISRMLLNAEVNGRNAYTAPEMFNTLQAEVWKETGSLAPTVDVFRRGLQRSYVTTLIGKLSGAGEVRGFATSYLRRSKTTLMAASKKTIDPTTSAHFSDLLLMIEMALTNPPAAPAAPTGGQAFPFINNPRNVCKACGSTSYHGHDENGRMIDPCWLTPIER